MGSSVSYTHLDVYKRQVHHLYRFAKRTLVTFPEVEGTPSYIEERIF